jgi:O-antigen/teichoic acid export membrane protein
VLVVSSGVAVLAICAVSLLPYWGEAERVTLAIQIATLPLLTLTIVYVSALQAIGSLQAYALNMMLSGVVPLLIVVPSSLRYGLEGWNAGRVCVALVLFICALWPVRSHVLGGKWSESSATHLWRFARLQIISGALSLVVLSADVIVLERMTRDLLEVATYGVSSLFARATSFVPVAIGRVYFKEIGEETGKSDAKRVQFLLVSAATGLLSALFLAVVGPWLVQKLYPGRFAGAGELVRILSCGVVFSFLWQSASTINIASGWARESLGLAAAGGFVGLPLMVLLSHGAGAKGLAWATNFAYAAGALYGLYSLSRRRVKIEERT